MTKFKYSEKMGIPITEMMDSLDDKMILEAAQGNISYSAPIKTKIRDLLLTLEETINNKDHDVIKNLLNMTRN